MPPFARRPDLHVVGPAAVEDVADLLAGHQRRRGSAHIARLQAVALRRVEFQGDLNLRHFDEKLFVQVDNARDVGHGGAHHFCLVAQHVQVGAEQAHHDGLARTGEHFADALLQVGLQVAVQPGVALHHLVDGVHRLVVVDLRVDADPVLAEVDAHHFVGGEGLADVSAEVAHAGDGAQFLAGPGGDAHHFRMRGVGLGHPMHQEVAFLEIGQQ